MCSPDSEIGQFINNHTFVAHGAQREIEAQAIKALRQALRQRDCAGIAEAAAPEVDAQS